MLIKFHNHGTGCAKHATDYLLGVNNDRKKARILSGDRKITELLIDSINRKSKYKSGVLSFEEKADQLLESQKLEIMRDFEKVLFPGLEPDQYDILWVEHSDKDIDENSCIGRLELNFLIPTVELRSGKRLQPYWGGADRKRVNAFKDITNIKYNLSDPNAPSRKRTAKFYDQFGKKIEGKTELTVETAKTRAELKYAIHQEMIKAHEYSFLTNRVSVINKLRVLGLQVSPLRSKKTITVSSKYVKDKNGKPLKVRLEGAFYAEDFKAVNYIEHIRELKEKAYNSPLSIEARLKEAQALLDKGIKIKTQYHKEIYTEEIPQPHILDVIKIQPDTVGFTDKKPLVEYEKDSSINISFN